ncbi:hypothetical protein ACJX0J_036684, partial [Zea mays]
RCVAAGERSGRERQEHLRPDGADAGVPVRPLGGGSDAAAVQMQRVQGGQPERQDGAARGGGGRPRQVRAPAARGRRQRQEQAREPGGQRRRRRRDGAAPGGAARARRLRAPAGGRARRRRRAHAALRRAAHGVRRRRERAAALRGRRRRGQVLPDPRVARGGQGRRQLQRVAPGGRGQDVGVPLAGARPVAQVSAAHPQVPALRIPLVAARQRHHPREGLRPGSEHVVAANGHHGRRRRRRRRMRSLPRKTLQRRCR